MLVKNMLSPRGVQRARSCLRIAFKGAYIALALLLIALLYLLMRGGSSTTARLSIATSVTAIVGALVGGISKLLSIRASRHETLRSQDLFLANLIAEDTFVDRTLDIQALNRLLEDCRMVNCHGQRGVGKSFLLEYLADLINGHRRPDDDRPLPRTVTAALYIDLADAIGFDDVEAQVCRSTYSDRVRTWSDFISWIDRHFPHRPILLILDNVNSNGLWQSLGVATYRYMARRTKDRIIVGSIEPMSLYNYQLKRQLIEGFDEDGVKAMARTRGFDLTGAALAKLEDQSDGLPFYVGLLLSLPAESHALTSMVGTATLIEKELLPQLDPDEERFMAYISLLALLDRRIEISDVAHLPIARLDAQLRQAQNRSLLSLLSKGGHGVIKVHDLVRDSVLLACADQVAEAALFLFRKYNAKGRDAESCIFALFADPDAIGHEEFDRLFHRVIVDAVRKRNWTLLATLRQRVSESNRLLQFIDTAQQRSDLFSYGRASHLAGLGKYVEAADELLSSSTTNIRPSSLNTSTELQLDMYFMQADVAHLQNCYDDAAEMFTDLGDWAAARSDREREAKCLWGLGHVLRHQGRELDRALTIFRHAVEVADESGELFAKVYSLTGATGIKVFQGQVPDDEDEVLADLEAEIAVRADLRAYMLEVWKSQAQVAWLKGDSDHANEIIAAAISEALVLNDRLVYNLYFERAEFLRLSGRQEESLSDYQTVLRFGEGNGDRNLIANALLGIVSAEFADRKWDVHGSEIAARAAAMRARALALSADIHVTAAAAEEVVVAFDTGQYLQPVMRYILF